MSKKKPVIPAEVGVFFEKDNLDDSYEEWTGLQIRGCARDEDFPMEVLVEVNEGQIKGVAFTHADVRRFIAEAHALGIN